MMQRFNGGDSNAVYDIVAGDESCYYLETKRLSARSRGANRDPTQNTQPPAPPPAARPPARSRAALVHYAAASVPHVNTALALGARLLHYTAFWLTASVGDDALEFRR
ncbi:hypothetical protein EVAR_18152_1 [Eumeta japonica]|uniref:Uncharacterized protein n=1 Tax=Eumeta variegata TaxID=151549 RepID=A0A4C1UV23_EUMVA|nr:hypothetical protein EVAR_18152_1 [Eumeta japonica]